MMGMAAYKQDTVLSGHTGIAGDTGHHPMQQIWPYKSVIAYSLSAYLVQGTL